MANARIPLSSIARDPAVAAFLKRGERDNDAAYAIATPHSPVLTDGAAKALEMA